MKLIGFSIANLKDLLDVLKEDRTKEILSSFCCDLNPDVESFLQNSAIEFQKQGISSTHLVFSSYKGDAVLVAYFTLANKFLTIPKKTLSNSLSKKINKFGVFNRDIKAYQLSCPLIAQLGKNYHNNYNKLITGDELLKIACDEIQKIQLSIGGKMAYVECEDIAQLIDFYESNGFVRLHDRYLTKSEKSETEPDYLVQLIKKF